MSDTLKLLKLLIYIMPRKRKSQKKNDYFIKKINLNLEKIDLNPSKTIQKTKDKLSKFRKN